MRVWSAWAALPPLARWPLTWLALLVGASILGRVTNIGAGNGIFLAGGGAILFSLTYIRFGGERTRLGRDIHGKPIWGIEPDQRRAEIQRGVGVFLVGAALWAVLGVSILVGVRL